MKLFILFGLSQGNSPRAMTVVDEQTIQISGRKEEEYKRLALDATREQCDETIEQWGWFEVQLPPTARMSINDYLRNIPPSFSTQVSVSPTQKNHPSYEGIKVTVGRNPGVLPADTENNF